MSAITNPIRNLFSGGPSPTVLPAPTILPAPQMPSPNDESAKKAKKKALVASATRKGRASTIMSDYSTGGDTLG